MIFPNLKDLIALKNVRNPFINKSMLPSNSMLAGNFTAKVVGQGLNFASNREYVANDDLRHINWRLTAKNNKPYVKTYNVDTDQIVLAVIDNNSYMHFGTKNTFKSVQAINCAALIAWQCLAHKERIGFYCCGGPKAQYLPTVSGEKKVISFLQQLCVPYANGVDEDFADVLEKINHQTSASKIVYLISDFISAASDKLAQQLKIMRQKHQVVLVSIVDKFDFELPAIGGISLLNAATKVDLTLSPENIKKYRLDWNERKAALDKLCLSLKITNYWISTEQKWNS
jgi:uncharacterized protein (DUF58 family)